jgi:DNA-binding transcriptional LysR family regulator
MLLGAAEGLGASLTGTVQIDCFSAPAPSLLPPLLATAAEQFPELQVETTEVNLAELAEEPMVVPIRDDAPALSVVLITAANARPTRRAQAIARLCRERLAPS